ncbi:MAG TPA: Ig-like domain-containing protein, partial [Chloroflexota bacterium]|nr:Ig-like domain-containing protein [Chloroflexota bacterium]
GTSSIESVTDNAAIDIAGGSLTLTSGTSQVSGALTVAGGATLSASGSGTTFTASGATNVDGANLFASGGAVLSFPTLTSYTGSSGSFTSSTIQASGVGPVPANTPSRIDLSHVTSLTGLTGNYGEVSIKALAGAEVDLSKANSNPGGSLQFAADGAGSTIDLSTLGTISSTTNTDSLLQATNSGTILDPLLTTLSQTDLTTDVTGSIGTGQMTSITGGTITTNGGTMDFSGLTTLDAANLYANGGGELSFPILASYVGSSGSFISNTIEASGVGPSPANTPSRIDLSHVTSLTGLTGSYGEVSIKALAGALVDLSKANSNPGGSLQFAADGAGSTINLSSLGTITSTTNTDSSLEASDGGTISLNIGTVDLTRVDISAMSTGTVTGGTLKLLAGSSLSGNSTIQANVINVAATNPGDDGTGVLTIGGNFTQYGAGTLNVQVGAATAGSPYDQLVVTGAAQFNGTISIALANGFTPQVGDSFPIITYASRSGEFATYNGLSYAAGQTFRTLYSATTLSLLGALADVRVFPTTGLLTSKAGDATSFTVVLATPPTADVTLGLSSSNTSEGTVSPASLTFTPADWNVAQTVTVTGVNDNQPGSVAYQVVFAPAASTDSNYSGLTTSAVSLTNLPSEVQNIQVANLEVNPSTGLNGGSNLTITWDDANTGNLPASASWDDQVAITNTTTGDTLTTALVGIDPNVDGVLFPAGSLDQQFSYTLPAGADGVGNLQITVTANVNHTAFESAASLTNANLQTYADGGDYPIAPTTLTVGGVDFALIPNGSTSSSLGILQTTGSGTSFDIPVNISGATVLNTLVNSTYGVAGDTVGTVEVKGTNGADAVFSLVEGTNIRDYYNGGYNNTIAPGTPSASFGNGQIRLDMQTFVLPNAFANARITDIILTSSGGAPQGNPFLAAATVTTSSGPSQLVLLGSGVAPDIANSATTTVVSGNILPGQVSVVLDPASDSGVQGDGLTDDTTPTFDVTVNEGGLIQFDFKGDGSSTTSQTVAAAGTYKFTSPALADGSYTAKVSFTPSGGSAVAASAPFTIDTKAPTLLAGSPTAQGPLYSRTLAFSKNMNAATIGDSSISISGPGITGSIQPASVIGSGSTYVVNFSAPLTKGGNYTLSLGTGITDLAGNSIGSGVADTFQLNADTTAPVVSAVSPSGLTNTDVSSLEVTFNKAINASTFTSSQVTINGPGGVISTSSITVTEVGAADYTIGFPTQTQEGTYNVSIGGPAVLDISGNAMAAAFQTSFTIDHSILAVVSVSPTGTINGIIDHVDVTFNKAML